MRRLPPWRPARYWEFEVEGMSELDALRGEIDQIDRQLVELFLRRMEVTGRVGA